MVDNLDKAHMATVGKVFGKGFVEQFGVQPGVGAIGINKSNATHSANVEKKRQANFALDEAERDRIWKSLGQTNSSQSVLGN